MPREEEGVRVAPSRRLVGGYSLTYRYSLTDKSLGLATGEQQRTVGNISVVGRGSLCADGRDQLTDGHWRESSGEERTWQREGGI